VNDIIHMDASHIAELIAKRELSPVEVMQAHLDRIAEVNPRVNAIVTVADGSLDAAKKAEAAVKPDARLGPLHGVPFTVKDGIDTAGVLTQRGSPIFKGRVPGTDATVVARLKAAGAILIAKTNPPEFSYSIETDNLLTGQRTTRGTSITPRAGRAVVNPLPSQQACRHSAWAVICRSHCAARQRIPVSSDLKLLMVECR
jgi:Asp-tRNA(Asn)/Glu-tRNA(Gln) amidotransferase A subunit family amidase